MDLLLRRGGGGDLIGHDAFFVPCPMDKHAYAHVHVTRVRVRVRVGVGVGVEVGVRVRVGVGVGVKVGVRVRVRVRVRVSTSRTVQCARRCGRACEQGEVAQAMPRPPQRAGPG